MFLGGVAPYGYAVSSSVFGVSDGGVFEVVTAATETGELTATVSVSDEARGRVAVAVSLSVRFVEGVGTGEAAVSVVVGHDYTGELHSVVASGGSGEYVFMRWWGRWMPSRVLLALRWTVMGC